MPFTCTSSCIFFGVQHDELPGFSGYDSPNTAARETTRAALMYFSISIGESDSTSPMLSKPYPESSTGNSSAGRSVTPSRSRIVLLYSARFKRRAVTRPGLAVAAFAGTSEMPGSFRIQVETAATSPGDNGAAGRGGIWPRETLSSTFCQTSGSGRSRGAVAQRFETQFSGLLPIAMTSHAVARQHGQHVLLEFIEHSALAIAREHSSLSRAARDSDAYDEGPGCFHSQHQGARCALQCYLQRQPKRLQSRTPCAGQDGCNVPNIHVRSSASS